MGADRTLDPARKPALTEADDWPVVLDGELMRSGEAMIPAADDGLIRGDGAFDAFPVRGAGRSLGRRTLTAWSARAERSCSPVLGRTSRRTSTCCWSGSR